MATTNRKTKQATKPAANGIVMDGAHIPLDGEVTPRQATATLDDRKTKLDELATEIRSGHGRCMDTIRGVVTQAAGIGKLLIEAKKLVGHGKWKAWVEHHCRFAMRMAQNYMLVARWHEQIVTKFGNDAAGWTLTDFIKLAHKLEGEERSAPSAGQPSAPKPVSDPFRLPAGEVTQRQQRFQTEVREVASERVAKDEAMVTFVRGRISALYAAVRRFVASKEVTKLAGEGLDAADLGMLIIDRLKASLDPSELLVAVPGEPSQPTESVPQRPDGESQTNSSQSVALTV